MKCAECRFWLRGKWVSHPSVPAVFQPVADEGQGKCRADGPLSGIVTKAAFGCADYVELKSKYDQEERVEYQTEPWDTWEMGPCPDCQGKGSTGQMVNGELQGGACHRCAGTAQVRYYIDGYVGDEQTREHPTAKKMRDAADQTRSIAELRAELARLEASAA